MEKKRKGNKKREEERGGREEKCKTRENSNFLKNGKKVILVKTRNFSRSRMAK